MFEHIFHAFLNAMQEDFDDDEPVTSQPGAQSASGGAGAGDPWNQTSVPIAMPPPGGATETTGLTSQGQQQTYNPYPNWE